MNEQRPSSLPPLGSSQPGLRPVGTQPPAGPAKLPPMSPPAGRPNVNIVGDRPMPDHDPHRDSIAIEEEPAEAPSQFSKKIQYQSLGMGSGLHKTQEYKRPPNCNGNGACRVRSFHGRLSDEGMSYMDDKINEWMDAHPEYEIKFVTTTVGLYDGKIKEQALIVNVWY